MEYNAVPTAARQYQSIFGELRSRGKPLRRVMILRTPVNYQLGSIDRVRVS